MGCALGCTFDRSEGGPCDWSGGDDEGSLQLLDCQMKQFENRMAAAMTGLGKRTDLKKLELNRTLDPDDRESDVGSDDSTQATLFQEEKDPELFEQTDQTDEDQKDTILIFDWDDTLCPTAWAERTLGFDDDMNVVTPLNLRQKQELDGLSQRIERLLTSAMMFGTVVIVTNADRPWVSVMCGILLPRIKDLIDSIPVYYAGEFLSYDDSYTLSRVKLMVGGKAKAMRSAITEFYGQRGWKNIISIGDAIWELKAIKEVVTQRQLEIEVARRQGKSTPVEEDTLRTKTIKLVENPTLFHLQLQLATVSKWLPDLIDADCDIDVDLGPEKLDGKYGRGIRSPR